MRGKRSDLDASPITHPDDGGGFDLAEYAERKTRDFKAMLTFPVIIGSIGSIGYYWLDMEAADRSNAAVERMQRKAASAAPKEPEPDRYTSPNNPWAKD